MNLEKSIPDLKAYYSKYHGDKEVLKQRIRASMSKETDSQPAKLKLRFVKTLLIGVPSAVVLMGAGVFAYHSTTMTQPHAMTKQQIRQLENKISEINTHYGSFERTNKKISLPNEEISYSSSKVTAQTKEIILPYGIFIKQ